TIVLLVIVDGSQIDTRGRVLGIEFQDSPIGGESILLARGVLLDRHCSHKKFRRGLRYPGPRSFGLDDFGTIKFEKKLPGERIEFPSLMPEGKPRATREDPSFQQRVLHSGNLLLHGIERGTNHCRPDLFGSELA